MTDTPDRLSRTQDAEREVAKKLGFSFRAQNSYLNVTIEQGDFRIVSLYQPDGNWDVCYLLDGAWKLLCDQQAALTTANAEADKLRQACAEYFSYNASEVYKIIEARNKVLALLATPAQGGRQEEAELKCKHCGEAITPCNYPGVPQSGFRQLDCLHKGFRHTKTQVHFCKDSLEQAAEPAAAQGGRTVSVEKYCKYHGDPIDGHVCKLPPGPAAFPSFYSCCGVAVYYGSKDWQRNKHAADCAAAAQGGDEVKK